MLQTLVRNDGRVFFETSCGTLVINAEQQILLGHVTGTDRWDIPKGRQEPGESCLEAARRELKEETGLEFEASLFEDIGDFDYRPDKRLHLFRVYVMKPPSLLSLACSSHFPAPPESPAVLAMDGFRWARRDELPVLCLPRLASRLLSLYW